MSDPILTPDQSRITRAILRTLETEDASESDAIIALASAIAALVRTLSHDELARG